MPLSIAEARTLLGADVLGPEEIRGAFGAFDERTGDVPIPFTAADLGAAKEAGEMLVLRLAALDDSTPLTILRFIDRSPSLFDPKFLRSMGYQLRDEWGVMLEPLAGSLTCATGWALVRKDLVPGTANRAYEEQVGGLERHAAARGLAAGILRRRTAIEAVYDTLLYFLARGDRLLARTWDWSASRTLDGGYLNVGGFTENGLQILSYSTAVRHGALGLCSTRG